MRDRLVKLLLQNLLHFLGCITFLPAVNCVLTNKWPNKGYKANFTTMIGAQWLSTSLPIRRLQVRIPLCAVLFFLSSFLYYFPSQLLSVLNQISQERASLLMMWSKNGILCCLRQNTQDEQMIKNQLWWQTFLFGVIILDISVIDSSHFVGASQHLDKTFLAFSN